jgi:hypothetical protein
VPELASNTRTLKMATESQKEALVLPCTEEKALYESPDTKVSLSLQGFCVTKQRIK